MGAVLCRTVEVANETNPGVDLELREVESDEQWGELIVRLGPGESREINGSKFINRSFSSRIHRSIHVTAVLSSGETTEKVFSAYDFAKYGKVIIRLVGEELRGAPVVISYLRRLRFSCCVGGN